MADEFDLVDETMDVETETSNLIDEREAESPPIGYKTNYAPGEEGFQTRMQGAPAPITDVNAPGGAQARLEALESAYPSGMPGPSMTGPGMTTETIGGREYRLPGSVFTSSRAGAALPFPSSSEAAFPGISGAPVYKIPPEYEAKFNDVLREVMEPGRDIEELRAAAQGMRGGPGESYKSRPLALKLLAEAEGNRRRSIAGLADSLTKMMLAPSKFYEQQFEAMLGYGEKMAGHGVKEREIGLNAQIERERTRAIEEGPSKTVEGFTPEGMQQTLAWDRETQTYKPIPGSEGMRAMALGEGESVISPMTGKTIVSGGEKGSPKKENARSAYNQYLKTVEGLKEDFTLQKDPDLMTDKALSSYNFFAGQMKTWGFGEDVKPIPPFEEYKAYYSARGITDDAVLKKRYRAHVRQILSLE
jgi:hypothetical protein